ncbi:MAG TPA: hypothetical protein VFM46_04360, partial [Pseudomonadales bacterium]|nr:hypothetical protein [Pseudomonadales bacterium]
DSGTLAIYNPFTLRCDSGERVTLSALTGCSVTDTFLLAEEACVVFDGRIYLSISLRPEDFVGSEAFEFSAREGEE